MIRSVKFVSIPVVDQERALKFYTERLGFVVNTDQPFDDKQRWIELRIPKSSTRVVLFTPPGQAERVGSFMNMAFETDNMDKTYTELKERGVEFTQPPKREHWGCSALFKDSEGNQFCLSEQ